MNINLDMLKFGKSVIRLYDKLSNEVCKKYNLTKIEMDIIAFLANHPNEDTAVEIVDERMLIKSNVSEAVNRLVGKKMIERFFDDNDRRKVHLKLTLKTHDMQNEIHIMQQNFCNIMFKDFSENDIDELFLSAKKISNNAIREL
ncbi:MAG: MarR family winged helix-turn-helix transcriptional regulator [Clostridia bacterium]